MARQAVAKKVGCTTEALRRWYLAAEKAGTLPVREGAGNGVAVGGKGNNGKASAGAAPAAAVSSSVPHDPGSGLGQHEVDEILKYKRQFPSMGPAQIRAQLKRHRKWRLSVKAIARVLVKGGYPLVRRGSRPDEPPPQRFEAPHRNALWQIDFTDLLIGPERRYLLVIEDDFSRFVVGHHLCEGPTTEVATRTLVEAIRRHGKPERIYSDRGAAFTAWHDLSAFEAYLDAELIDHSLRRAHHPRGAGKIEAVMGTVQRELWQVQHFDSVAEAEQALERFFADYNHRRAHLGIGGLCPADRFFGRWPEVAAEIDALSRRRQGALAVSQDRRLYHEAPQPSDRAMVLQLVLCGDRAELCFLGRRILLGNVES
jgi:transposase InsO family protein